MRRLRLRPLALVLTLVLTSAAARGEQITLARDGKTSYVIVVDDNATAAEKHAARDLRDDLQQVTGATFEVQGDAPKIIVGPSKLAHQLLPQQNWESLGTDGIVMK